MKVLFVAVFTPNSTNVSQARGFKDNGCEVYEYDYRARRKALSGSIRQRDDELIKLCKAQKPDLTAFSKCNHMHHRVIDECNKYSTTVLWYMDALDNFDRELREKVKRVKWFVNGIEGVVPHGKKINPNTIYIPQCPDEKMNFPFNETTYRYDCTFIGARKEQRAGYIDSLKGENFNFQHFNNVYGLQHNRVVNETRINLNFSHATAPGASVRIFKILAAQSFLLTTPWKGMEQTFTPGEDFDTFSSSQELKDKIKYYLAHPHQRDKIRLHGHKTVQQYMPKQWAQQITNLTATRPQL